MTIHRIEVDEYECELCHYRWINRVNGVDKPIPQRCAKCKRQDWDEGQRRKRIMERPPMTPEAAGLRTKIKNLHNVYYWKYKNWTWPNDNKLDLKDYWDFELVTMFLSLQNPRPTARELHDIIYSPGTTLGLDSQNQYRLSGFVPDPDRGPGWLKYDRKEFPKVLESDKQKVFFEMEAMIVKQHGKGWRRKARRMIRDAKKRKQEEREKQEREWLEEEKKNPASKKYHDLIRGIRGELTPEATAEAAA